MATFQSPLFTMVQDGHQLVSRMAIKHLGARGPMHSNVWLLVFLLCNSSHLMHSYYKVDHYKLVGLKHLFNSNLYYLKPIPFPVCSKRVARDHAAPLIGQVDNWVVPLSRGLYNVSLYYILMKYLCHSETLWFIIYLMDYYFCKVL